MYICINKLLHIRRNKYINKSTESYCTSPVKFVGGVMNYHWLRCYKAWMWPSWSSKFDSPLKKIIKNVLKSFILVFSKQLIKPNMLNLKTKFHVFASCVGVYKRKTFEMEQRTQQNVIYGFDYLTKANVYAAAQTMQMRISFFCQKGRPSEFIRTRISSLNRLPFVLPTHLVFSHYRSWLKEYELPSKVRKLQKQRETQVTLGSFERNKEKENILKTIPISQAILISMSYLSCLTSQSTHTIRLL